MQVHVDDISVPTAGSTLTDALNAARAAAESRGRVIVEATLDGVTIPDELLSSPTADEFRGSDVRFLTAHPGTLVGSTLRGIGEALLEAKATHAQAGELIQRGEIKPAMESLAQALKIWDHVREGVLSGSALLGVSIEDLRVIPAPGAPATSVSAAVQELADHLSEIKRSFVAQDWSALGDALSYDLPEQADRWSELLGALADQLESGTAANA